MSTTVKDRLARVKGDRSWDEFLAEVADEYVDDAIALAERRLDELKSQKARGLTLREIDQVRSARVKPENRDPVARSREGKRVDGPRSHGSR